MLDIGMSEMVIIGVVALIVVGPKDLPQMFRKVGVAVGKARGMARDFQNAMHDAADQSGVNDLKSSFDQAASLKDLGLNDLAASKEYSADLKPAADIPSVAPPKAPVKVAVKKTISKNKTSKMPTKKSTSEVSSKKIEAKVAIKKQLGKKAK